MAGSSAAQSLGYHILLQNPRLDFLRKEVGQLRMVLREEDDTQLNLIKFTDMKESAALERNKRI